MAAMVSGSCGISGTGWIPVSGEVGAGAPTTADMMSSTLGVIRPKCAVDGRENKEAPEDPLLAMAPEILRLITCLADPNAQRRGAQASGCFSAQLDQTRLTAWDHSCLYIDASNNMRALSPSPNIKTPPARRASPRTRGDHAKPFIGWDGVVAAGLSLLPHVMSYTKLYNHARQKQCLSGRGLARTPEPHQVTATRQNPNPSPGSPDSGRSPSPCPRRAAPPRCW